MHSHAGSSGSRSHIEPLSPLISSSPMDKTASSPSRAVADIPSGATLAVGGFGLCGIPSTLISALLDQGASNLAVVSNNCGVDDWGLGLLLAAGRIAKMTSSYVGENKEFARQYLAGELEVELLPQGTLAESLRAGGMGIPAYYTPAGVGTLIADGKETRVIDGREYLLEPAITADFALVRAAKGDRHGNLVFHASARNFNPVVAMAGRVTLAEVEELVEPGALDPDEIHLPGVFVQRVVAVPADQRAKRIEKRTVTENGTA
jgi:3-oxoacid CoA-transferase subunit A